MHLASSLCIADDPFTLIACPKKSLRMCLGCCVLGLTSMLGRDCIFRIFSCAKCRFQSLFPNTQHVVGKRAPVSVIARHQSTSCFANSFPLACTDMWIRLAPQQSTLQCPFAIYLLCLLSIMCSNCLVTREQQPKRSL